MEKFLSYSEYHCHFSYIFNHYTIRFDYYNFITIITIIFITIYLLQFIFITIYYNFVIKIKFSYL